MYTESHFMRRCCCCDRFDENMVVAEQVVVLDQLGIEVVKKFHDLVEEALGQIMGRTADGEVAVGKTRPTNHLEEVEDVFPLAERVEKWRECADVESVGAETDQVGSQPIQFTDDDTDELRPARQLDIGQRFHLAPPKSIGA